MRPRWALVSLVGVREPNEGGVRALSVRWGAPICPQDELKGSQFLSCAAAYSHFQKFSVWDGRATRPKGGFDHSVGFWAILPS